MLATKNTRRRLIGVLTVAASISLLGCKPAGPRALVEGDKLLLEGNPSAAIEKLKRATVLMPEEPRAWNLLGLAYHQSGEPQLALQAYRHALARDRSNIVAVTHYNLGSLLLEQNNPAYAVDELRSYTLLTNSALGLVRLATAQFRLRQFDSAERSFAAALRLDPKNIEALNGIGVIHAQRNQRDAVQYFNSALQLNPKYGPAMLNAAALSHQSAATKPAALQRYRDYLALHPMGPQSEAVKLVVRQLESELEPLRPAPATTVVVQAVSPPRSIASNAPAITTTQASPSPPRIALTASNTKPQAVVAKTNAPPSSAPVSSARSNQFVAITNPAPVAQSIPVTVVTVATDRVPRIAVAEPIASTSIQAPVTNPAAMETLPDRSFTTPDEAVAEPAKRGFFTRLNPFRGRSKPSADSPPQAEVLAPVAEVPPSETVSPALARPTFPRYAYQSPGMPPSGNRPKAERAMQEALRAHHGGRTNEALIAYQRAIIADQSYFDAHYNAALLALQSGDLNRSLAGWEMALAIEPESVNARYNFALTLKQGNYARDAAGELEKLLAYKPSDARAHLSLANLYAQQLNEREKARLHYLKVLELEPRNPQAPAIRFWLAANP